MEEKQSTLLKRRQHSSMEDGAFEVDLFGFVKYLLTKLWLILLVGVLAAAIVFEYTVLFIKPTYRSTAKMYVNNSGISVSTGATLSISGSSLTAAQSLVNTYIEILFTRETLNRVIEEGDFKNDDGTRMSYETLYSMIEAAAVNNTEIFSINVEDTNPERAKSIANTILLILPLQISKIVDGSSVKVVDYAVEGELVGPGKVKNAVFGFIGGVFCLCVIYFIIYAKDQLIHDESYLLDYYNIPLLAVIPDLRASDHGKYYYRGRYSYYKKYKSKYQLGAYDTSKTANSKVQSPSEVTAPKAKGGEESHD